MYNKKKHVHFIAPEILILRKKAFAYSKTTIDFPYDRCIDTYFWKKKLFFEKIVKTENPL